MQTEPIAGSSFAGSESYQADLINGLAPPPTPQPSQSQVVVPQMQNLVDLEKQNQMVQKFSQFSGMKPDWSKKCLDDCHWDFEVLLKISYRNPYFIFHFRKPLKFLQQSGTTFRQTHLRIDLVKASAC